jgi:hypothetical protein
METAACAAGIARWRPIGMLPPMSTHRRSLTLLAATFVAWAATACADSGGGGVVAGPDGGAAIGEDAAAAVYSGPIETEYTLRWECETECYGLLGYDDHLRVEALPEGEGEASPVRLTYWSSACPTCITIDRAVRNDRCLDASGFTAGEVSIGAYSLCRDDRGALVGGIGWTGYPGPRDAEKRYALQAIARDPR